MAGSMNRVTLIGALGKDPEIRQVNGQDVAELRIATNERWTDKEGQSKERTEWHRIVVWGKQADVCRRFLEKGQSVCIEGRLQTREYEKNGEKRFITEIVCTNLVLLARGGAANDDRGQERGRDSGGGGGQRDGGGQGGRSGGGGWGGKGGAPPASGGGGGSGWGGGGRAASPPTGASGNDDRGGGGGGSPPPDDDIPFVSCEV